MTLQAGDPAPFAGELVLAEDLAKLLVLLEEANKREAASAQLTEELLAAAEDQRLDGESVLKAEAAGLQAELESMRAERFGWEWLVIAGLAGVVSGGAAALLVR